jgi:ATP-dependent DNA helicase RecG
MITDDLRKLIRKGEGSQLALVKNCENITLITQIVCSFLNTNGGTVLCGVDSKGHLIGITEAVNIINTIRNRLQVDISPKAPLLSVTLEMVDNHDLVSIEVPEGQEKPYVNDGVVYIRQGSRNIKAAGESIRKMIRESTIASERWERRPSVGLNSSDLDTDEIRKTVNDSDESGRFSFMDKNDPYEICRQLGLAHSGQFTQAADVLFSKHPAHRHPQIRVRAVCFSEDKESADYIDDSEYEGPLVGMLNDVERFLLRNTRTRVKFEPDTIRSSDRSDYPVSAVREGLVNAFAHRDYSAFHGGVAIRLFPSRLEIWNTGHLPEGLKPVDLKREHPSIPVNPDIVHVLYIRGYMNRIGRGTQKIVNACRENGLPTPQWRDDKTGVTLTLFARKASGEPTIVFNNRQIALLNILKKGQEISPQEYRERFAENVSERHARRDLRDLVETNMLEKLGAGAGTSYRRTHREWKRTEPDTNRT